MREGRDHDIFSNDSVQSTWIKEKRKTMEGVYREDTFRN